MVIAESLRRNMRVPAWCQSVKRLSGQPILVFTIECLIQEAEGTISQSADPRSYARPARRLCGTGFGGVSLVMALRRACRDSQANAGLHRGRDPDSRNRFFPSARLYGEAERPLRKSAQLASRDAIAVTVGVAQPVQEARGWLDRVLVSSYLCYLERADTILGLLTRRSA